MSAYYNENNPFAVAWLRNLITAGHIAPGDVDARSIVEVSAGDLNGYDQCHFFAGIGVWSYALRSAGWSDNRPVWTGSCPCQPFSGAGKKQGFADDRHLWPAWFRLLAKCRPAVIFGEQVASPEGLGWFDTVHADLERADYAVGGADLCAAGVGAPHIRQRLFFVADAERDERRQVGALSRGGSEGSGPEGLEQRFNNSGDRSLRALADTERGRSRTQRASEAGGRTPVEPNRHGADGIMGDAIGPGPSLGSFQVERHGAVRNEGPATGPTGPLIGPWAEVEWVRCTDGKARPTQPGVRPLAPGTPGRVGKLRAYGNAIVAPVATEFVMAYLDTTHGG
jgi:DNA (cytosine-5)-methyltransferase 1